MKCCVENCIDEAVALITIYKKVKPKYFGGYDTIEVQEGYCGKHYKEYFVR